MKTITKDTDAYGAELMAIHRGETDVEIIERDDGYIEAADGRAAYFGDASQWPDSERTALGFLRGRVLDIGAGAGRHAVFAQQHGLRVTAIDNSPLAVRVARLRGVKDARVLPFEHVARLAPLRFDTLLMLGNNFGLFGSPAKLRRMLRALRRITAPGARIIAQTLDPHRTRNPAHRAYHQRNRARGRMAGQVRIRVRHLGLTGPWFDYLFVSVDELKQLLQGSGWTVWRIVRDRTPQYLAIIERCE